MLLALLNGMDLPCSCATVLLVLRYSKVLTRYCVTVCNSVTLLLSLLVYGMVLPVIVLLLLL